MDIIEITLLMTLVSVTLVNGDPYVCINYQQCIRGTYMPGYQTEKFEAFMGIPYARPPVGDYRFADTVPAEPWQGDLNATHPGSDCIQKNYLLPIHLVTGEEDCLYLNVYRPLANLTKPLPVMVYIHGGGFFSGSANPLIHGPEYFMDTKKVILVTLAYRLGAFGLLSTGDLHAPGNLAFKDQVMALKWVSKHISNFGGNPDLVTIFGQSAGGASVHMLMLSPLSKGLFQRAIAMSGNAMAPYSNLNKNPLEQARLQAKFVDIRNADTLSSKDLISALRKVDAKAIVESGDKFKYWHIDPLTTYRPVIDNSFLSSDPSELIARGSYHNNVPWMTSFVDFEGGVRSLSIVANDTLRNQFNERFDELLYKLMELPEQSEQLKQATIDRLVEFYLNGSHEITPENAQRFGDMISDRAFLVPLHNTIKQYVRKTDQQPLPVYFYKFNYKGPYSYSFFLSGTAHNYGVVHCDDLIYLFRSPLLFKEDFPRNSVEAKLIKTFVENFITFAQYGQPRHPVKHCNEQSFNDNSFCDYQEFRNSYNDFTVSSSNAFDVDAVRLWNDIVKED